MHCATCDSHDHYTGEMKCPKYPRHTPHHYPNIHHVKPMLCTVQLVTATIITAERWNAQNIPETPPHQYPNTHHVKLVQCTVQNVTATIITPERWNAQNILETHPPISTQTYIMWSPSYALCNMWQPRSVHRRDEMPQISQRNTPHQYPNIRHVKPVLCTVQHVTATIITPERWNAQNIPGLTHWNSVQGQLPRTLTRPVIDTYRFSII